MVRDTHDACEIESRAEIISLGAVIVIGIAFLMSAFALFALMHPSRDLLQIVPAVAAAVATWLFVIDSCSERLLLIGNDVTLTSRFRRVRRVSLSGAESLSFHHEGFNLEQGMVAIEVRKKNQSLRLPLGPCWQNRTVISCLQRIALQRNIPFRSS